MLFDRVYNSQQDYFGVKPSPDLAKFVTENHLGNGLALDLGCGQGRNAIFLAQTGFSVVAIDMSFAGLKLLSQFAGRNGLKIQCILQDVEAYHFPKNTFHLVVASTILDHLNPEAISKVASGIIETLVEGGVGYVSVFTIEDPGYSLSVGGPRSTSSTPSECAEAIRHYFGLGELRDLFRDMNVIQYVEKTETDTKHGPIHLHGITRLIFKKP